jgi:hypothetical protein
VTGMVGQSASLEEAKYVLTTGDHHGIIAPNTLNNMTPGICAKCRDG